MEEIEIKTYICHLCKKQKTDKGWYPVGYGTDYYVCTNCFMEVFFEFVKKHPDFLNE